VTTIISGAKVTLTATVKSSGVAVTAGQVNFCDATAAYCTDIHILGSAQLTSAGSATWNFLPGVGSHSYKAAFVGTSAVASSSSSTATLTVTGKLTTATSIAQSGSVGNYSLTATVTGTGSAIAPSGTVSYLDTSALNAVLGSSSLRAGVSSLAAAYLNSSYTALEPDANEADYNQYMVSGDFNGDGKPDLAILVGGGYGGSCIGSGVCPASVLVLLNNGNGIYTTVSSPITLTGGDFQGIVVGDFNRDGKTDLAISEINQGIFVLLGNGDGTFTKKPAIQVGTLPTYIAAGDFNLDGKLDLAVINFGERQVIILLGNGDGTFSTGATLQLSGTGEEWMMAVADMNGDGLQDLVICQPDEVSLLLGNGDGTFRKATSILTPQIYSNTLAVADFNNDGKPDLAVGKEDGSVLLLLGNGDGTFKQGDTITLSGNLAAVSVADFNQDGNVDLAVLSANGSSSTNGSFQILLGNGDGTFTSGPRSPATKGDAFSITATDLNGDGVPDLAEISDASSYQSGSLALSILTPQLTQTATATTKDISVLGTGTHQIEASYPGDTYYASSESGTTGLTAQTVAPSVTVQPSLTGATTAQALPVTVTVSYDASDPTPTGSVKLTSGSYTSTTSALTSGAATINIPAGALSAGTDTLTVSYTPDTGSASIYTSATGSAVVTVTKATPTVTVSPSPTSITALQSLSVTVTVAGTPTPTGSITLTSGSYTSSAMTLSSGSVTINIAAGALAVGNDTLTATYTPDASSSPIYGNASGTGTVTVAQTNPTPSISTFSPTYADAGGAAFTLTVNGAGFVSGSTVYWGTFALATTYVSATQLTASVPATDIAASGTTSITVQSPTPGGGASNALKFEVDSSDGTSYPPTFTTLTTTVTAGSSASYPVTLSSSASNISATCLNLPTGATCSYSSGALIITTSSSTPSGTYPITVVFAETITKTVAAWIFFPFLLVPLAAARKKLVRKHNWITACLGVVILGATMIAVGCGGGSGSSTTKTQTEQVTSSATVTLTVK
jgi:hypothetical protein